ncbi:uncharacterized protein J8A68_005476 [[Candida] subhashii]|uniref:Uncharacterized protein n=1 Tax=[Candida] subhashii TaxID=561895 RepID=A0A8J5QGU4_9ASCO|nr:uncharacterized protein J8A68_005476 [[Candida] subhashii]KAG7660956.1 hypothetical protein J8A68_005476 [[Candida] subhashii]
MAELYLHPGVDPLSRISIPSQVESDSNSSKQLTPTLQTNSMNNPFALIYDSADSLKNRTSAASPPPNRFHDDASYRQISSNFTKAGSTSNQQPSHTRTLSPNDQQYLNLPPPHRINPDAVPTVTIIDERLLKRSGSIISKSATLRNRNKIKQRNKTVLKHDLQDDENDDHDTKTRPRFVFPIKRKTSLKYKSLASSTKPNFSSREQLVQFLNNCNYQEWLHTLIPSKMKVFKHKNILKVHPDLTYQLKLFEINSKGNITSRKNSTKLIPKLTSKGPRTLVGLAYQKYRENVFARNSSEIPPPKFQDLYPDDVDLLSDFEIEQINTQFLFEILLRRTISAKIEFRLQSNRPQFTSPWATTTSSSSWKSSSRHSGSTSTGTSDSQFASPSESYDGSNEFGDSQSASFSALSSSIIKSSSSSRKSPRTRGGHKCPPPLGITSSPKSHFPHVPPSRISIDRHHGKQSQSTTESNSAFTQTSNQYQHHHQQHHHQKQQSQDLQQQSNNSMEYELNPRHRSQDTISSTRTSLQHTSADEKVRLKVMEREFRFGLENIGDGVSDLSSFMGGILSCDSEDMNRKTVVGTGTSPFGETMSPEVKI